MKIYDAKTGKATVVFKEYDIKRLEENGYTRCVKCGAKLKK